MSTVDGRAEGGFVRAESKLAAAFWDEIRRTFPLSPLLVLTGVAIVLVDLALSISPQNLHVRDTVVLGQAGLAAVWLVLGPGASLLRVMTILVITLVAAIVLATTGWAPWRWHFAFLLVFQAQVILTVSVMRLKGWRLRAEQPIKAGDCPQPNASVEMTASDESIADDELTAQSQFSLAHLLGWMTACCVLCGMVPQSEIAVLNVFDLFCAGMFTLVTVIALVAVSRCPHLLFAWGLIAVCCVPLVLLWRAMGAAELGMLPTLGLSMAVPLAAAKDARL